jgi:hypothetical protein
VVCRVWSRLSPTRCWKRRVDISFRQRWWRD